MSETYIPIVHPVDAIQYTGDNLDAVKDFLKGTSISVTQKKTTEGYPMFIYFDVTRHLIKNSSDAVPLGWWVVKHYTGKYESMPNDEFMKTYERKQ